MMRKIMIALFLLFSCSIMPVLAVNWYYVGTNSSGRAFYIDNSSVIKNKTDAIVWYKIVSPNGTSTLFQAYMTRTYPSVTLLAFVNYNTSGKVSNSGTVPNYAQKKMPIPPGSISDSIWHLIWPY